MLKIAFDHNRKRGKRIRGKKREKVSGSFKAKMFPYAVDGPPPSTSVASVTEKEMGGRCDFLAAAFFFFFCWSGRPGSLVLLAFI